jgi:hypothetical protein
MNYEDRLRRLCGSLDAAPGFEERVMQRVATLPAAPRSDLRAQFERRRALRCGRLRREAWMNGLTALGLGACAGALLWRYESLIRQVAGASASLFDPQLLGGSTIVTLVAALWLLIRRSQSRS